MTQFLREQLPRSGRSPGDDHRRPAGAWSVGGSGWPRCASSAAPRRSTRSWSAGSRDFLGTDDAILYGSCFDANGGLFETLLGPEDAVISDELNHASIIDGVRLCKATRMRYANRDMADLEAKLQEAQAGAAPADRNRRRVLDGRLRRAAGRHVGLAERYDALVMVDDSHAVGLRRADRCRDAGTVRRPGSGRHRHRNTWQGPGRGERRVYRCAWRDRRDAAAAFPAVSVLQFPGALDRGRRDRHAGSAGRHPASCCNGCGRTRHTSARRWWRVASRFPSRTIRSCRS